VAAGVKITQPETKFTQLVSTAADTSAVGGIATPPLTGTDGNVLTYVAATPALALLPPVGFANPMTTPADIIVGGTAGAPVRLAKGTDGQVLTVDPTTHLLLWATPSAGVQTTKGDLAGYSTLPARVPIGSDGLVLVADSTQTLGLKWATVGGGGASLAVQYPALKPATPTDDFNGVALAGAWSAHSSGGTFATADCMTQGVEWMGSSIEMQFSAQMGLLSRTHANTDLDFSAGGMQAQNVSIGVSCMFGIAALDSSGTGVGVVSYTDGNAYLVTITTYQYAGNSAQWVSAGWNTNSGELSAPYWFRLKRVSGTWTAYMSASGRVWDHTFATRADSITVSQIVFGLLYNTGSTYSGRLTADYFDVQV
jgi:hypothetical protein